MLSFHFLFMRKPTLACPLLASECYVQQVATLESCETFLFSSDFSESYHVPFHIVFFQFIFQLFTCSSLSNVLTLYVAIVSRSPRVWCFFTYVSFNFLYSPFHQQFINNNNNNSNGRNGSFFYLTGYLIDESADGL